MSCRYDLTELTELRIRLLCDLALQVAIGFLLLEALSKLDAATSGLADSTIPDSVRNSPCNP